jgi:AraC-like DNA-binding protein
VTQLTTHAARAGSDVERVHLLIAATLARVGAAGPPDRVTTGLAGLVLTDTPVAEIARLLGLSPRQVHRRCLDEFGLAPTLLRRIARVHRAARYTASTERTPLARLAADTGFTDQAHLCREVREGPPRRPRRGGSCAGRPARHRYGDDHTCTRRGHLDPGRRRRLPQGQREPPEGRSESRLHPAATQLLRAVTSVGAPGHRGMAVRPGRSAARRACLRGGRLDAR